MITMKTLFAVLKLVFIQISLSNGYAVQRSDDFSEPISVPLADFPYVASLYYDKRYECAGTILKNNLVLTSADCVEDHILQLLEVQAGSQDAGLSNSQWRAIKNVYLSNLTSDLDKTDEIAVLELTIPLNFDDKTDEIPVMSEDELNYAINNGYSASVVGRKRECQSTNEEEIQSSSEKVPGDLIQVKFQLCPRPEELSAEAAKMSPYFKPDLHFCFDPVTSQVMKYLYASPVLINNKLAGIKTRNVCEEKNTLLTKIELFNSFLNNIIGTSLPEPTSTNYETETESTAAQPDTTQSPTHQSDAAQSPGLEEHIIKKMLNKWKEEIDGLLSKFELNFPIKIVNSIKEYIVGSLGTFVKIEQGTDGRIIATQDLSQRKND